MIAKRQTQASERHYDVIMVGSGLASTLTALRLQARRPNLKLCLLEARDIPDDGHTWCCFDTDLSPEDRGWIDLLWSTRWPGYDVRFPKIKRELSTGYNRLAESRLNELRHALLWDQVHYGASVSHIAEDHVILESGERLHAPLILDGRGAEASPHLSIGYQKFVGREVTTREPHGVARPMIMDATVEQIDGYRFVYVLPLNEDQLLIEDTVYSDGSELTASDLKQRIYGYAKSQGWRLTDDTRTESGVLPITLEGDFEAYWKALGPAAPIGMKALMFHPTTGYSLPYAIRMARIISDLPQLDTRSVRAQVKLESQKLWRRGNYLRLLNRMMFRAAGPAQRYLVLQRFYGLPQALIERFYAGNLSLLDRVRILAGKPPVPIAAAVKAMRPSKE